MNVTPTSLALISFAGSLIGCGGTDNSPTLIDVEAYIDSEVLVGVDDGFDGVRLMELRTDFEFDTLGTIDELGIAHLRLDGDENVRDTVASLIGDHRVRFAEPNYIYKSSGGSDPYRAYQWNLDQVRAEEANRITDGRGTIVAVLDTGVSSGPDGIANLLGGWDFYENHSDSSDNDGHGTFVAGTIAQNTGNGIGVAGMAPGASILPVKVMSDQGYGSSEAIANGIVWSVQQGADVINMSLGSAYPSQTIKEACDWAYNRDVVLVAASGNEFSREVNYPAAFDSVIAVGATRHDGTRAGYSNTGRGLEFVAPGGDLSRDQDRDGYADGVLQETLENGRWTYTFWEGTSMASPHVAAAAAMLKSVGIDDPGEIRDILAATATDGGRSGYDTSYGDGLINIERALEYAVGNSNSTPEVEIPEEEPVEEPSVDITAPTISNVTGFTSGDQFTIEWTTNELSDSYVRFDEYGAYGDPALKTAHTLTFTGARGMTFVFTIESTDDSGNLREDGKWQITL